MKKRGIARLFSLWMTFVMLLCQCGFITTVYAAATEAANPPITITRFTFDDKTKKQETDFGKDAQQVSFPLEIEYEVELEPNTALNEILFEFEIKRTDNAPLGSVTIEKSSSDALVNYIFGTTVSIKNPDTSQTISAGSYLHELTLTMPAKESKAEYSITLKNVSYNLTKTEDGKSTGSVYFYPTTPGKKVRNGKLSGGTSDKAVDIRIGQYASHPGEPAYVCGDVYFRYYVYLETIPSGGSIQTAVDALQNWLSPQEKNGGTDYAYPELGWMKNVNTTAHVLEKPITFGDGTVANAYLDISFSATAGKLLIDADTIISLDFSSFTAATMYPRANYSNSVYWKQNNSEILIYGTDPVNTNNMDEYFIPGSEIAEVIAVATFYGPEPDGFITENPSDYTKGTVALTFNQIKQAPSELDVTIKSVTVYEPDGITVKKVIGKDDVSGYSISSEDNGKYVFTVTSPDRAEDEEFEFTHDLKWIDRIPPTVRATTTPVAADSERRLITLMIEDQTGAALNDPRYHPLDAASGDVSITGITCNGAPVNLSELTEVNHGSKGAVYTIKGEVGKTYTFTVQDKAGNVAVFTITVPLITMSFQPISNVELDFDPIDMPLNPGTGNRERFRLVEMGRFQALLSFNVETDVTSDEFTDGKVEIVFSNTDAPNFKIVSVGVVGTDSYKWASIGTIGEDKQSLIIENKGAAMGEGIKTLRLIIDIGDGPAPQRNGTPAGTPSISIESIKMTSNDRIPNPDLDWSDPELDPDDPDNMIAIYDFNDDDVYWAEPDGNRTLDFIIVKNPRIN